MENPKATRHNYEQDFHAKYFASGDFWSAGRTSNMSFTWRSILEAREVIKSGVRWKIGYGQRVRVWHHPWIPRPHTFMPITPCHPFLQNIQVSDLMCHSLFCWNSKLIDHIFYPEDARIIKSIPLGRSSTADSQIWHFDKRGTFSVKSAYHVALRCLRASSNSETEQTKVPHKVKIFAWRLCHDALPTTVNLCRCWCNVDPACSTCGYAREDVRHAVLDCHFARQSWAISNLPWAVISVWQKGSLEWMRLVRKNLDHSQCKYFLIVCWSLWRCRNQLVMEQLEIRPLDCISMASKFFSDYLNCVIVKSSSPASEDSWTTPRKDKIIRRLDLQEQNRG
ncbi:UNVERIFIED_CONTAM: hypothetical protein Slati_3683300 [Sesamum latifolium]|uniref:Reverse transcriptase zinc-binding domain-containing protein n=1 Tax=Sesamum latifolium TaxID=2727402 RepID=A0AAW2U5P1_9LAMI